MLECDLIVDHLKEYPWSKVDKGSNNTIKIPIYGEIVLCKVICIN